MNRGIAALIYTLAGLGVVGAAGIVALFAFVMPKLADAAGCFVSSSSTPVTVRRDACARVIARNPNAAASELAYYYHGAASLQLHDDAAAERDIGWLRYMYVATERSQIGIHLAALDNQRCWTRALAGSQLEGALKDCNASLRIRPNAEATINSRGYAYYRLGRYPEALRDLNASMDGGVGNYSRYIRGLIENKTGKNAAGAADIAAAELAFPNVAKEIAR